MIKELRYSEAVEFVLKHHYSNRKPQITFSFGYYVDNVLSMVCTFGKPASNSLCEGVCGKDYKEHVYELNRLCVNSEVELDIPLSKFVAMCLKELRKFNLIIVSYADKGMNHNGYIYQATNWIYTGATKERTDKYTEGGKHSRHYDKDKKEEFRKVRTSKHRYIYFCANKTIRNIFKKNLKYGIEEYPKGDNERYEQGFKISDVLVRKVQEGG